LLELADARFHLSLFIASCVVSAVLFEITFGTSGFNLGSDLFSSFTFKAREFSSEAICRFLG
jgi:hypothetical protein